MIPTSIFTMWLRALLAIAIIAGGIYLLRDWVDQSTVTITHPVNSGDANEYAMNDGREHGQREFQPDIGLNKETAELIAGATLLVFSFSGGILTKVFYALTLKKGKDDPSAERNGIVQRIKRPDGSEIQVESYGSPTAPAMIFSHGWGTSSEEWYYVKKHLSQHYHIIVWDQPGLGRSKKPDNNDYHLEKLANDLKAVVDLTGEQPVILAGHSIGGMMTLTFCRLFPELLGHKVKGLVLAHTTYINPVRTTKHAVLDTALEKPVLVPLLYLTIALWPLVWVMNWLSYLNGSAHRSTHRDSFAGTETRGQLNFITNFMPLCRPDILCYGMFGMLKYDASDILSSIHIPVLVIDGNKDTTTIPAASEKIRRDVGNGVLTTLAPAKHMG